MKEQGMVHHYFKYQNNKSNYEMVQTTQTSLTNLSISKSLPPRNLKEKLAIAIQLSVEAMPYIKPTSSYPH